MNKTLKDLWKYNKKFNANMIDYLQGQIQVGGAPAKIGKKMIFGHKILIFHTKYPKNFRASLCSAQFF